MIAAENEAEMNKWFACLAKYICLSACILMFNGCENGGGTDNDFGTNNPKVAVALGDSITALEGGNTTTYPDILAGLKGITVINEGHGGDSSDAGVDKIGGALSDIKPGYVLILYGANDIISGSGNDNLVANLRAMIVAAKNNKTVPIVATVTPMYFVHDIFAGAVPPLNALIRKMAAEENCAVADLESAFGTDSSLFNDDGLHPNDAGLRIIAQTFADRM